jgi:homoserine O-acetyltransferase/O-succinyltransferase
MLRKTNWCRATPAPIGRLRASRDQLFALGQPLDAAECFMVTPIAIGCGGSSKPSHGLKTKSLHHRFHDIVESDYQLIIEGLGVAHLRLVIGSSMAGMHAWMWAEMYPGAAPIAC